MKKYTVLITFVPLICLFLAGCSANAPSDLSGNSSAQEQEESKSTSAESNMAQVKTTETKGNMDADISEDLSAWYDSESIISAAKTETKIEAKVKYQGIIGDTAPENWSEISENMIACGEMLQKNYGEGGGKNIVLQLMDEESNILITFLNGKVTYSKFQTYDYSENPPTISLEEFNQIKTGMTVQDVYDIVGSSGTMISEVDLGLGSEYRTIMFQWDGEGSLGANANVTFQGGKVIEKAQFGLE